MVDTIIEVKEKIEAANTEAIKRITEAQPVLVGVAKLKDIREGVESKTLTHSGPPVTWDKMSGAQRGAVFAACIYEGWAKNRQGAEAIAGSGEIKFIPNHDLNGVGPMAGIISPNMYVYLVENKKTGKVSYSSTEFDAFFGAYDDEAIAEIRRWNEIFYPVIGAALLEMKGLDLKPLMAQALSMGDELHSRQTAASSLFAKRLASPIVKTASLDNAVATLNQLAENELTFLPIAMAAAKSALSAAENITYSTIVTVMSRNGTEIGIKVSGLNERWFTDTSPRVDSIFFPGYKLGDDGLDIGDSAITETFGLGAFASIAAPAIAGLIGSELDDLDAYYQKMESITTGKNQNFPIPQKNSSGILTGIDIRKVVDLGISPILDTATAHKEPGHRIIAAGVVTTPLKPFQKALKAWSEKYL